MTVIKRLMFSALLAFLPGGPLIHAAEFEVLDRFSVDGYTEFRGTVAVTGGSFAVGGSTFVVKGGNVGIGTAAPCGLFQVGGGSLTVLESGNVGIGTTNPSVRFEVNGEIKIGTAAALCGPAAAGTMHWDGSHFYGCTGAAWRQLDNQAPPSISAVTPASGVITGGTAITISGAGFHNLANVTIDEVPAANVVWVSAARMTATTPAGSSGGAKDVKVANPDGGYGLLSGGFRYDPVVTSVGPGNGPVSGGTTITVTGSGFVNGAGVKINNVDATGVTWNSGTQLTAAVPAGASSGAKDVRVTNPDGGYGALSGGFRYDPVVTSVGPGSGPVSGGTTITIEGSGFVNGAGVKINNVDATGVTWNSAAQLTAAAPAGSSGGSKDVKVANPDGGYGLLSNGFRYDPVVGSASPTNGTISGGTVITVTGGGFVSGAGVRINDVDATGVTWNSAAQITATTPAGTSSGAKDLKVTNPDSGYGVLTGGFRYNPAVSAVSPGYGTISGGTAITITGSGFVGGAGVTINNVSASNVTWNSAAQITATTPAGTSGGVKDVRVTNPDSGYGVLSGGFRYDPVEATGGTITNSGGYRIHTFTGTGANTCTVTSGWNIYYLIVAGGGGGGSSGANYSGGGGAGGLLQGSTSVSAAAYPLYIGGGGGAQGAGANSTGFGLTAIGGGAGTSSYGGTGGAGGSGGGGGPIYGEGGAGTSGQGYKGGNASSANQGASDSASGGGGGAGGPGDYVDSFPFSNSPGAGGAGLQLGISGTSAWYAAGGSGSGHYACGNTNGIGGCVSGGSHAGGTANTGSGGGGGMNGGGGSGGSGIIIIRYPY